MKRRDFLTWGGSLLVSATAVKAQSQPPRMVVDNRGPYPADIWVWRFDGQGWRWLFLMTVGVRSWTPLYYVSHGEMYRAILGPGGTRDHAVTLVFDPAYGGYQDVWLLY